MNVPKLMFFSNHLIVWAATWQNQQNDCAPSEDSDQPGLPPSLIRVFAVRLKKPWVLSYPFNAQRMPRLIWVFTGRTLILLVLSCHGSCVKRGHTRIRSAKRQLTAANMLLLLLSLLSHVTRKPVFGVCDQGTLKPACAATEARQRLETLDIETRGIILSGQRTTKTLIRLRGCTGWSASLLFAYGINRFSHDVARCSYYLLSLALLIARHLTAVGSGVARVTCETSQVLLAGGQPVFLGDLTFTPHLTIASAQNECNDLDGS